MGLPDLLPDIIPTLELTEAMFEDFHMSFRNFGSWHGCQRSKLLSVAYQAKKTKIFDALKPEHKGILTHLVNRRPAHLIASSAEEGMVQVDCLDTIWLPGFSADSGCGFWGTFDFSGLGTLGRSTLRD